VSARFRLFFSSLLATTVVLSAAAQGCSLITKTDRSLIPEGGGGAGGGGAGGDTTSSTGGGATGGTGGTGGATCTAACCSPSDCPVPASECVQRTCEAGVCGEEPVDSGVPVSTQTAGDCKVIVCDGAGATKAVTDEDDVPDDMKECTIDKCQNGVAKNTPAPAGQACSEAGGKKCDGSGACLECLQPSDCASKVCTIAGECAPEACDDGVKNGDETDIDCGGSCGATCLTNKACSSAADCLNKVCSGMPKKCAAPTCMDGFKNGDETDVDCGGACGATCGPAQSCSKNGDCKGGTCTGSTCAESCSDGTLNNSEKGVDCGGPICLNGCETGAPCDVPSDCTNTFCVDGFCCDAACTGTCTACSASLKTSGMDGICGPAKQGTDPHMSCDVAASTTCGDATGDCDGAGKCEKWPALTPCGDVASCTNGTQTNADTCDGNGACTDNLTQQCGLYACGATKCNTSCASDIDCAATAYCAGNVCVAKKANGAACGAANQCSSGSCTDGFCCNLPCNGACQACSVAAGGQANGTCSSVPANQDPAGDCGATGSCDGAGSCKKVIGQSCNLASECLSASCADGFCCDTPCVGLCQACSILKKGSGANGSCAFVGVGSDPDDECPGVTTCSGGGTCSLLPQGASCAINGECTTGFCVDGFCCGGVCNGLCQACAAAKTGGADGTCAQVIAGTDPDNECNAATNCDGASGCL